MTLRHWKRPRNFRKRFLRRMSDKIAPSQQDSTEPAGRVRRSLEKMVYLPTMEITNQPPTYDECVDYAPPLHPPPVAEKLPSPEKLASPEKVPSPEKVSPVTETQPERERGRPRELLYRLQLNDIMLRRPRRPSPEPRRPIKPAEVDSTNYGELLYCQSRATVWVQGFDFIRWATIGWLVLICFMLALAW